MHPARSPRPPGSFSPLSPNATAAPCPSRQPPPVPTDHTSSDDTSRLTSSTSQDQPSPPAAASPVTADFRPDSMSAVPPPLFAQHPNSSSGSLQNSSRPTTSNRSPSTTADSPQSLLVPPKTSHARSASSDSRGRGHHRKHSSQGHFEPSLPSASTASQIGMAQPGSGPAYTANNNMSASHIAAQTAAQTAVLSHQQSSQHGRQRSQTAPNPTQQQREPATSQRKGSASREPLNPPALNLTEASAPRESGSSSQGYRNGLMGSHSAAATTAANAVFPKSGPSSPLQPSHSAPPPPEKPLPVPEKPSKPEKKGRLFSRPRKVNTKGETDEKPLPSPGKIGSALSALQRGNFSTSSLVDSSPTSLYTHANSSSATIRPMDNPVEKEVKEVKEKEKKHHFLSRQKHKLKEEYHGSSSLKTADSHGLSSLYNLNLPPSPASNTAAFPKTIGGLDLRHGGRRDKRREERSDSRGDGESVEWPGPGSFGSHAAAPTFLEQLEPGRYGLSSMSYDDAWPFLKAKMLVVFEGEDLRLPVEDFNRIVLVHIQYCIQRRSPNIILDDLRDLLNTGFSSLDRALRKTPEDRVIPALVELWLFTFTSILPYMQAVFLPLDLEFAGCGTLLTPEKARDFWGGVLEGRSTGSTPHVAPASSAIDVRKLVLNAYRDTVILPRYEMLRTIFSRLSLEFLPSSFASMALASPPPDATGLSSSPSESFMSLNRPGTATGVDPSLGSYNSSATTLLGDAGRTRTTSNVSYGSGATSDGGVRPVRGEAPRREQNAEDSKQVAELAGRMLQCMSVLASVGSLSGPPAEGEEGEDEEMSADEKMEELCRLLKLNWLGRGRTGRNRRGIVGGRVRRGQQNSEHGEVRVA